jgi:hypothetical protein
MNKGEKLGDKEEPKELEEWEEFLCALGACSVHCAEL